MSTPDWVLELEGTREYFGQRAGSIIASRRTYFPTGTIETIRGWNDVTYLRVEGCRLMDASEYDEMIEWCHQFCPRSLTWLQLI